MTASVKVLSDHLCVPVVRCIGRFCATTQKKVPYSDIIRAYTDHKGRVVVRADGVKNRIFVAGMTIADLADRAEAAHVGLLDNPDKVKSLFNPSRQENHALLKKWMDQQNPACALI